MTEHESRALAIRDHVVRLISGSPADHVRRVDSLSRAEAGRFSMAFWQEIERPKVIMVWAMCGRRGSRGERIFAMTWSAAGVSLMEFQRGPWEGDVLSLHHVRRT